VEPEAGMIAFVWKWIIGSVIGRIIAGVAVGLVALGINNHLQRQRGAAEIITQSIKQGQAINRKNEQIRQKAKQPGAAERVLRDFCRDC